MTEKTKYNYFSGTALYNRLKVADQYGNYVIKIKLDDKSLKDYEASGIQVAVDEDNSVFFRRPHQKLMKNEIVVNGPPKVVDNQDTPQPFDELIGSGSDVIVKVRSYKTQKGTGHTLDAVKVIKNVPVEGTSSTWHNF